MNFNLILLIIILINFNSFGGQTSITIPYSGGFEQNYVHPTILDGYFANEKDGFHLFTVKVGIYDSTLKKITGSCTGVLIANDIVLTAGHCIKENTRALLVSYGLADKKGNFAMEEVSYDFLGRYSRAEVFSSYQEVNDTDFINGILSIDYNLQKKDFEAFKNLKELNNLWNKTFDYLKRFPDYAVIKVKQVPNNYKPISLYNGKLRLKQKLLTLGYGRQSISAHVVSDQILRWTISVFIKYYKPPEAKTIWGIQTYSPDKKSPCFGDSGGPTVINDSGEYKLVAITGFVTNTCGSSTWHFLPHNFINEINGKIRELRSRTNI